MEEKTTFYSKILIMILLLILNHIISKIIQCSNFNKNKSHNFLREKGAEFTLFLLKNGQFPIKEPCRVLLIGSGARYTLKGGLGSGDVNSFHYPTCEEGLESAGFKITTKHWLNEYSKIKDQNLQEHINYVVDLNEKMGAVNAERKMSFPEYDYNLKLQKDELKADIAIYVLSRSSGEEMDRRPIKGDIELTDTEVKDILYLDGKFKKFMLVLNVCGPVDTTPVRDIGNILLLSQLGDVTGDVLADIILGKQNPSGKLTTTWAKISDYKFLKDFGQLDDTQYKEGIYVGYRYFSTEGVRPLYPFGYGDSYSYFTLKKYAFYNIDDEIFVKVTVNNIGDYAGKEVIQVYLSQPQSKKDKPYQILVAFKKTKLIKPLGTEVIELSFRLSKFATYYEDKEAYILEKGNYIVRIGESSDDTEIYGYIKLNEDIITEKLKNIFPNNNLGFEYYKPVPRYEMKDNLTDIQVIKLSKKDFWTKKIEYNYQPKINENLKKLKNEELGRLCIGEFNRSNERVTGIAGMSSMSTPHIKKFLRMADGPAGLRLALVYGIDNQNKYHKISKRNSEMANLRYYITHKKNFYFSNKVPEYNIPKNLKIKIQNTTALPIATALAQSFNVELIQKIGTIVGKEMEFYNVDILLGPGMNIHRNILCGRNFEYFSEDPVVTGKIAAALINGVQSIKNKAATVKHFAANNQEYNRMNNNGIISERALREIYLKGFQIAIEESQPHALMTSYNLINGLHPSENKNLMTNLLRDEWGFKGMIMTDWTFSGHTEAKLSKHPPQNIIRFIKAGGNIMMPGSYMDYKIILENIKNETLTRKDLLNCASKVYNTIELLKN